MPEAGCDGEVHAGSERSATGETRGRESRASGCETKRSRTGGGTGAVGVVGAPGGGSDGGGGTVGGSACGKTEGGAGASGPGSR